MYDHVPALSAALKFWAQSLDNVLLIPFPEYKPVLLTQVSQFYHLLDSTINIKEKNLHVHF